jgi:hypothetical protein
VNLEDVPIAVARVGSFACQISAIRRDTKSEEVSFIHTSIEFGTCRVENNEVSVQLVRPTIVDGEDANVGNKRPKWFCKRIHDRLNLPRFVVPQLDTGTARLDAAYPDTPLLISGM